MVPFLIAVIRYLVGTAAIRHLADQKNQKAQTVTGSRHLPSGTHFCYLGNSPKGPKTTFHGSIANRESSVQTV